MVLHQNVNVGQRVEVKVHNRIYRGTVKYKGSIIHKPGDWVGVSLEKPGKLKKKRWYERGTHKPYNMYFALVDVRMESWTFQKYHN